MVIFFGLLTHHWWRLYSVPCHLVRDWPTAWHIRKILFVVWVKMRLRGRSRWKCVYTVVYHLLIIGLSLHVCHSLKVVLIWPRGTVEWEITKLLRGDWCRWLRWVLNMTLYKRWWRFSFDCRLWFTLSSLLLLVLLSKLGPSVFKPYLGQKKSEGRQVKRPCHVGKCPQGKLAVARIN